jgi:hypothetical protein
MIRKKIRPTLLPETGAWHLRKDVIELPGKAIILLELG